MTHVSNALLEGRGTADVLHLVARWARQLLDASVAIVSTLTDDGESMVVRVTDGQGAEHVVGMVFSQDASLSGDVLRRGRPLPIDDISADHRENQPLVRLGGMGPGLLVPLVAGGQTFGTLSVANRVGAPSFTDDDLLVLETFATEAAMALHHGELRADLERLALLEERERIAMELHDGAVQALFSVGLGLHAAQLTLDDRPQLEARLNEAISSIDRTIRELREYIFELKPIEATDGLLERSLQELVAGYAHSTRMTVSFQADPDAVSLLRRNGEQVVQIVRESMSNAVRHSGAEHLRCTLQTGKDEVILEVADDGCGFDPHSPPRRGHGLANLRSRAQALGGSCQILSREGDGTAVRIVLPV
ncbi:MAG: GAF domain-containing sensor histidine kinase [Actinobacteria bacterium]|nr:GAF domain-containing sensor histidine kinase [Actinomycetota bacterium]